MDVSHTPFGATLLRLVFDTAALRPSATDRHFWSHPTEMLISHNAAATPLVVFQPVHKLRVQCSNH